MIISDLKHRYFIEYKVKLDPGKLPTQQSKPAYDFFLFFFLVFIFIF